MSHYPKVTVHTSERQKAARLLKSLGWSCFWLQLVLTVVSGLIFGFATLDPNLNLNLKSGIGLLSVLGGMAALSFSLYWCFRYVRLGRKLDAPESALHPSRKETIEVLQFGVLVNLIAMLFTLVSIEAIVGSLLLKTLSVPQGAAVYRTGQLVVPIDIFIVQANISMIMAQFVGISIPFGLASRVDHRWERSRSRSISRSRRKLRHRKRNGGKPLIASNDVDRTGERKNPVDPDPRIG